MEAFSDMLEYAVTQVLVDSAFYAAYPAKDRLMALVVAKLKEGALTLPEDATLDMCERKMAFAYMFHYLEKVEG